MASTSATLSISSSALIDGKASRPMAATSTQCVTLPTLPPSPMPPQTRPQNRDTWESAAYCRKIARNVVAKATGDAPAEVATTELPEIVKTILEGWDKMEDKYATTSLVVASGVALWGSTGMISAIDRLPLVPGVLELVGIGYSGWFAYKNLIFKPERQALIQKVKDIYRDIVGSSA